MRILLLRLLTDAVTLVAYEAATNVVSAPIKDPIKTMDTTYPPCLRCAHRAPQPIVSPVSLLF